MKKLLLLLLLVASTYCHAQVSAYSFAASTGTFAEINGGTVVRTLSAEAGVSPAITIGFPFVFNGAPYNRVVATNDGCLSFNTGSTSLPFPYNRLVNSAAITRPLLAPLWDDLGGNTNSQFSYITTGTAGSLVFTAEWKRWLWNRGSGISPISFQVKLYEGTNKIEFVYWPEFSSVFNGNACIGLAASSTGIGNFLSLNSLSANPTASSTVETDTIKTKPDAVRVYSFTPPPPPVTDIAVADINVSSAVCPNAAFPLSVTVSNGGSNPINFASTNATLSVNVSGAASQNLITTISSGTLAPGATQTVMLSPALDLSANGTYNFQSVVALSGDANRSNDTLASVATIAGTPSPWAERFAVYGQLPAGWQNNGWSLNSFLIGGNSGNPGNCIYKQLASDTATGSFTTLSIGPVAANDQLSFDYRLISSTTPFGPAPAGWGHFKVQLSTDCGNSFTTIDSVADASATAIWNLKSYSLAAYAGQHIMLRIVPKRGTGSAFLAFDNFKVKTPSAIDLATAGAIATITPCPSTNAPVSIAIRNDGTNAVDFAATNATLTLSVSNSYGQVQTLSTILTNGTLAAGASQLVAFPQGANLSGAGTYYLKPYISLAGDADLTNDTSYSAITTNTYTAAMPWTEGFTGNNAMPTGWNAPGWFVWYSRSASSNTGYNIYTSFNSPGTSTLTTLAVGQITANTTLRFDHRVSAISSPYGPPLQGWGSFAVQISPNCSNVFTTLATVNGIDSGWIGKSYDLSAYAGQFITVRIVATVATGAYDVAFDNFQIFAPSAIDLTATSATVFTGPCPDSTAPVTVGIKNVGTSVINFASTPANITINVTGPTPQTLSAIINSGTLAPQAAQTVTLAATANLSASGTYNLKTYVTIPGDGNRANDTIATATTIAAVATTTAPWTEPFTTTTLPTGWTAPGWSIGAVRGAAGNFGNAIYQTLNSSNTANPITTLAVGTLPANSFMAFDYKVTGFYYPYTSLTSNFGNIRVQISTDCGTSYTTLDTITTANDGWRSKAYPMSSYAGKKVTIRIIATGNYDPEDFAFDNFRFYTLPAADMSLEALFVPDYNCPEANGYIIVSAKNNGPNTINLGNSNVTVGVQVSGPTVTQTLTAVLGTGNVMAGDTRSTFLSIPANFSVAGTYQLKGFITALADSNRTNDTLVTTWTNGTGIPWFEPFTSTLLSPVFIARDWQIGAVRGAVGNPGNSIYYNLYSDTFRTLSTKAIGPIGTANYLRFNYKLSDVAPPYNAPTAGWGYFRVQISTNCGSSFTTIDSITTATDSITPANNGWISKSYPLTNYIGQHIQVRIDPRWRAGNYDLAFDNFRVGTLATCQPPTSGFTNQRTDTSARVNFTATGNNFIIEYGPYGFTPGTGATAGGGTVVTATSSPVTINGLSPGTGYKFYIRQNCTATNEGFSANRLIDSFTTTATPVPLTNDLPANAITLAVGAGCTGALYTINGATQVAGEPAVSCSGALTGGKVVWFKFAAPASGFVKVSTDAIGNTLADTKAGLFSVGDSTNFSTFQILACDDDNGILNNNASIFYANGLTPGQVYYVAVDGYSATDTGRFCLQIASVDSGMIAASGYCNAMQQLPQHLPSYKGWLSVTDYSGKLVTNIRSNITMPGDITYYPFLYVNTGAVRQAATSEYYLDRNFSIINNFPTTPGNWDVQFFLLNRELAALQAVAPGTTLSGINVTRGKDSICHDIFPSGSADSLLLQSTSGTVNGVSWVTAKTTRLANFYLNPGSSPLPRIYVFNGNGAWSDPANWNNNTVPPAMLPPNSVIEILPVPGGQCILDINQHIPAGDRLRIRSGTNVVIPGSVIIQ